MKCNKKVLDLNFCLNFFNNQVRGTTDYLSKILEID